MDTQKQCKKSIALEFIFTHPQTTGGTEKIVFAVKSAKLKTLTEIRSTFNSVHLHKLHNVIKFRFNITLGPPWNSFALQLPLMSLT